MKNNVLNLIIFLFVINVFSQNELQPIKISSTKYNDFAPVPYKNGILFVSDRNNNYQDYSLYYYDFKNKPVKIKTKLKYNIGQGFNDQKTDITYVTSNNKITRKIIYENRLISKHNLTIYKGRIRKNKFKEEGQLSFCSPSFNYGYVNILNDKMILFTDDTKYKGKKYKILQCYHEEKKWIPEKVLFSDDEPLLNPTFLTKNIIVFSSKNMNGKGGYDLYIIQKKDNWKKPVNLEKYNTKYDELTLILSNKNKGYLSSNRMDNRDHIFKFNIKQ